MLSEVGGRRTWSEVPLRFDLVQDLKDRIIVRNTMRIVVGAVREAPQLAPFGLVKLGRVPGQLIANRLLLRRWQALHQLNDMQCGGTHKFNFSRRSGCAQARGWGSE